ncbi:4310_t:CDS:2, partial [Acaulospora colombiana]
NPLWYGPYLWTKFKTTTRALLPGSEKTRGMLHHRKPNLFSLDVCGTAPRQKKNEITKRRQRPVLLHDYQDFGCLEGSLG